MRHAATPRQGGMLQRVRELDRAWLVLAAAFVVIFVNSGSRMLFGVTLKPMQADLGWGRGALSSVQTVYMFVSALAMPFAGRLADRYGFRLIVPVFVVVMALGAGLTGYIQVPWQLFLLYGVVFALGSGGSNLGVVIVLVSRWFPRSPRESQQHGHRRRGNRTTDHHLHRLHLPAGLRVATLLQDCRAHNPGPQRAHGAGLHPVSRHGEPSRRRTASPRTSPPRSRPERPASPTRKS